MRKIYFLLIFIFVLRGLSFSQSTQHVLTCRTYGNPPINQVLYNQIGYFIDNNPVEYNGCQLDAAIIVAVIDSNCNVWNNCDHYFGQSNTFSLATGGVCIPMAVGTGSCRARPENYFIFRFSDSIQMLALSNMLSQVPSGFYILAYTWYTYQYSSVPSFTQAFMNLGAVSIATLPDTVPYIFFMKKNDPSSLVEAMGVLQSDMISISQNISCVTTGLEELNKNSISIFPNPVSEFISLSNINNIEYDWKIFDVIGQKVLEGKLPGSDYQINTSSMSAGLYFLELNNGDARINIRFLKQ